MDGTRTRRRTLVLVALIAATVVSLFLALAGSDNESGYAATPAPGTSTSTPPAMPAPDEAGAVRAGIEYATASQDWLYLADHDIESAVKQMASPDVASDLAAEVLADVRMAREGLAVSPGRVWWIVRPLAWRLEEFESARARIDVWVVTVLSAVEVAVPQAEWMTVTLELVWVDSAWRVEAVDDSPGPTPMVGPGDAPWDAQPFDHQLDGFTRVGSEARG